MKHQNVARYDNRIVTKWCFFSTKKEIQPTWTTNKYTGTSKNIVTGTFLLKINGYHDDTTMKIFIAVSYLPNVNFKRRIQK